MQVTLEIQTGPDAGRKLVLQQGQKALIGKASWADLSVPDDTALSGRHFTVEFDGACCVVRDYEGSRGTLLNGGPVAEAVLRHGDRIVAGKTTFAVSIAGDAFQAGRAVPSLAAPVPAARDEPAEPPDLLAYLRGQPEPLYALLDAARDPQVLQLLRSSQEEYESLYEGAKGKELEDFAPYLVKLPPESPLLETLVEEGWGKSWGVYLTCSKPFAEVRKHFRQFLLVKLEGGEEVYFRFYDPRVLRGFLPMCDSTGTREFIGPICSFLVEAEHPLWLLKFMEVRGALNQEVIELDPASTATIQELARVHNP